MHEDKVPLIYVCATMWHETENEMLQMMTSIFRLDEDQCARKNAQRAFCFIDPDFYDFEAHIVFDDAFEPHAGQSTSFQVNSFVKQLLNIIDKAARNVHEVAMQLSPPTKFVTPFGGRLEWNLPGGNRLAVHLKDKSVIRNKKRWSQVLYLFYLLDYQVDVQNLDEQQRQTLADNTFILTLDGDVDFKPSAVQLLVDRMKRNRKVGAVCGRIHPIGKGPLVWYQVFDYAVGFWLQKATEHTIGCNICTSGCFSLFRASAVMDKRVIDKYVNTSSTANHIIKVDQGEDRWLCTLLLRHGYKVEYSGSAHALTYAPEGFEELFNQRRRWLPADYAHTIDLLLRWPTITKSNEHMTHFFMVYQLLLFFTTMLRPSTMLLLISDVLSYAFPGISFLAYLVGLSTPVMVFQLSCFLFNQNRQIWIAKVMCVGYGFVMIAVFTGVGLKIQEEGMCSWATILLMILFVLFTFLAILHVKESSCLMYVPLFFLAYPLNFIFTMIYSISNMHLVSWGTREVKTTDKDGTLTKQRPLCRKGSNSGTSLRTTSTGLETIENGLAPGRVHTGQDEQALVFDGSKMKWLPIGKMQRRAKSALWASHCHAFTDKAFSIDEIQNKSIDLFSVTHTSLQTMIGSIGGMAQPCSAVTTGLSPFVKPNACSISPGGAKDFSIFNRTVASNNYSMNVDERYPLWIGDCELGPGKIQHICEEEKLFWDRIIEKHLYKLELSEEEKQRIKTSLTMTRNRMSWAFFLINVVFAGAMYTLQIATPLPDGIPLPCQSIDGLRLAVDNMIVFLVVLNGVVILIQLVAVLCYKIVTAFNILRHTDGSWLLINVKGVSGKVEIASTMQKTGYCRRRSIVTKATGSTLDNNFKRNFQIMADSLKQGARNGVSKILAPDEVDGRSIELQREFVHEKVKKYLLSMDAEEVSVYLHNCNEFGNTAWSSEHNTNSGVKTSTNAIRILQEAKNKVKHVCRKYILSKIRGSSQKRIKSRTKSMCYNRDSYNRPFNGIVARMHIDIQPLSIGSHYSGETVIISHLPRFKRV